MSAKACCYFDGATLAPTEINGHSLIVAKKDKQSMVVCGEMIDERIYSLSPAYAAREGILSGLIRKYPKKQIWICDENKEQVLIRQDLESFWWGETELRPLNITELPYLLSPDIIRGNKYLKAIEDMFGADNFWVEISYFHPGHPSSAFIQLHFDQIDQGIIRAGIVYTATLNQNVHCRPHTGITFLCLNRQTLIKIVRIPAGNPPVNVKKAWVGLILEAKFVTDLGIIGPEEGGWMVETPKAMAALERVDESAAKWYKDNWTDKTMVFLYSDAKKISG